MPDLIVVFGPPASGKAAIGHVLAQRLGYRFFHNHLTANPVAALFGWATPQFGRVVDRVRELLFREAAADPSIPGIVFTFVWGIDLPENAEFMEMTSRLFEAGGGVRGGVGLRNCCGRGSQRSLTAPGIQGDWPIVTAAKDVARWAQGKMPDPPDPPATPPRPTHEPAQRKPQSFCPAESADRTPTNSQASRRQADAS